MIPNPDHPSPSNEKEARVKGNHHDEVDHNHLTITIKPLWNSMGPNSVFQESQSYRFLAAECHKDHANHLSHHRRPTSSGEENIEVIWRRNCSTTGFSIGEDASKGHTVAVADERGECVNDADMTGSRVNSTVPFFYRHGTPYDCSNSTLYLRISTLLSSINHLVC